MSTRLVPAHPALPALPALPANPAQQRAAPPSVQITDTLVFASRSLAMSLPIPDRDTIARDSIARFDDMINAQPCIDQATVGLPRLALDSHIDPSDRQRLCPKSVLPWHDAHRTIQSNWDAVLRILADAPCLQRPPEPHWIPLVQQEAAARQWLDDSSIRHALNIIRQLHTRVQSDPSLAATRTNHDDQPLLDALANVGRIWAEPEKMRQFRTAKGIDLTRIGRALESDAAFHHTWGSHTNSNGNNGSGDGNDNDTDNGAAAGRRLLQSIKDNLVNPISDIEVCWDNLTGDHYDFDQRGLPLAVIELKSPIKLTSDKLLSVIHDFGRHCLSADLKLCWTQDADIRLRAASHLLADRRPAIDAEAAGVLHCLRQIYHNMFVRRLTYGILTSVTTSLLVRIDWHHQTHPGQVVHVATHTSAADIILPKPQPATRPCRHSLVHILVALLLEQLQCGLVPQQKVDHIISRMIDQLDSYPSDLDLSDTDSSDADPSDARDSDASYTSSSSGDTSFTDDKQHGGQHDKQHDGQHGQLAAHLDGNESVTARNSIYTRLLASLKRDDARAELEKLVEALEDRRNVAVYAPHQLGALLCAVFPLRESRNKRKRKRKHPRSSSSSSSAWSPQADRYLAHDVCGLEVLLPRTLDSGPVPAKMNRRLAYTDDVQLARAMLAESGLGASTTGEAMHARGVDAGIEPADAREHEDEAPELDSDTSLDSDGSSVRTLVSTPAASLLPLGAEECVAKHESSLTAAQLAVV